MTTGRRFGELPVSAPELLDLCDRALGEVSRRRHLFGWLRASATEDWLPVDAYYPGHRLVVLCRDAPADGDDLIAEKVPEHGLRLLRLVPAALAADPAGVDVALGRRLDELGPAPPRPRAAPADGGPGLVAATVAALAQREPAARARQPRPPRPAPAPSRKAVTRGVEFVAAHRGQIDENAHEAAVSRHREPIRSRRRQPIRRRTSGPAATRVDAATPAARRHPVTAALLIALLIVVVVVAIAIITGAHGR